MRVYLAGGMRSDWQDKVILPFLTLPSVTFYDPRSHRLRIPAEYSLWDKAAIKNCDVLFAYMEQDNPSGFGMAYEIGFAIGLGKTVLFVNQKWDDKYWKIVESEPVMRFLELDDGIRYLRVLAEAFV